MNQLIVQHNADATFSVVRPSPDYRSVSAGGTIVPPAEFDVVGTPGAKLTGELRWLLEKFLDYPFEPRTTQAEHATAALKAWGEAAFLALFNAGDARDLYRDAVRPGVEQLRLIISSDDPQVLSWPWEALHDPALAFIAHSCDIERKLTARIDPPPALPDTLPRDRVNVLLVTCRPDGDRDVGYRSISRPLVDRVHAAALPAEVTVLRPPTFEQLERVLSERPGYFHVLHFDGHGAYGVLPPNANAPSGLTRSPHVLHGPQGCLAFEKADGTEDLVPADKLSQLMLAHKLPAVVLNACQSAMVDGAAESAFASVAASLVRAGVRSVVAMAYSLYVTGAQRFLPAFYETLFRTGSFASATRGGRRAMLLDKGRVCAVGTHPLEDWLVPVLYQQEPFAFAFAEVDPNRPPAPAAPRQTRLPPDARLENLDYGFVGRDAAILALERGLLAPAPVLLVHGLGGAGKTTLARGFADWLDKTGGLDACLWLAFDNIHSAEFVLDEIGALFFPPAFKTLPPDQKLDNLGAALKQARVLMIWDNFESASGNVDAGVAPLLKPEDLKTLENLLAKMRGGKSRVILTSRSEEENWLPKHLRRKIELGGLRDEDCWEFCDLITRTLGLKIDRKDENLIKLLDLLEGHPLLMRVVLPELENSTPSAIAAAILANGVTLDDRTAATLKFVEDRLPADLKPLLVPLALHERFLDVRMLTVMAEQQPEPKPTYDQIDRFCRALATAGLMQKRSDSVLQLHPALTRHLHIAVPAIAFEADKARWEQAFSAVMAVLADLYAPKHPHEQRVVFSIHEANLRSALDLARAHEMHAEIGAILQSLAAYSQNTRRWHDAEKLYGQLAEHSERLGFERHTAGAFHQLGRVAEERHNSNQAKQWYLKSLGIKKRIGDEPGEAVTYHQLGVIAERHHDLEQAEHWYLKSLEIKQRLLDERSTASTYHQLGTVSESRRDFERARQWYLKALAISERFNDEYRMAFSYHQLGSIAQGSHLLEEARQWYLKSLAIREHLGDESGASSIYHQLGMVAQLLGDLDQAGHWYFKALAIKERLGDERSAAVTYHQLGTVAQERRDLGQAVQWYLKSLAIEQRFGNELGAAITCVTLGLLEVEGGKAGAGMRWFVKATRGFSIAGDSQRVTTTKSVVGQNVTDPAIRALWPADELGPLPEPTQGATQNETGGSDA